MITVFGSINLDLIFRAEALPHPGQTVLAIGMRTEPGGKGANQAAAAARDGGQVTMVGAVGRDAMGEAALRAVTAASLSCIRVGSQNSLPNAHETDAALQLAAH